jgi:magnesium transporter
MIRVLNLGDNKEEEITLEKLKALNLTGNWIELVDPISEELQAIAEKTEVSRTFFDFPEIEGQIDFRLEPNLGIINFVILQDVTKTKTIHPIVIVFTKDFLVTVSKKEDQKIIQLAKSRMKKAKVDPPGIVTYFILDEIVSSHFEQLENIEEITANLEEDVVEKTSPVMLKKIFALKARLTSVNKLLWYERGVIFNLRKCGDECVTARARSLFDTTHEDLTRQIDIVETYREIMSDAINVHLSSVSNKINFSIRALTVVIFYLTIITTLTSFPNTVATFFGISQFGQTPAIIIWAAIILSIILPLLWLWKKKWLKLE